jgi:hypothetical protein
LSEIAKGPQVAPEAMPDCRAPMAIALFVRKIDPGEDFLGSGCSADWLWGMRAGKVKGVFLESGSPEVRKAFSSLCY